MAHNGELIRPSGLIRQGSGRTDPNSRHRLPVDDVPAVLGRGEYVVNQRATEAVGLDFLNNINNIGLGNSNLPRGTGNYGNYQQGGQVGGGMDNPIIQVNLHANPGEFVYRDSGKSYMGPYHQHQDGTYMIGSGDMGVVHNIKSNEVIVRDTIGRNDMATRRMSSRAARRMRPNTRRGYSTSTTRNTGRRYQRGGRVGRRFQQGGHAHPVSNDMLNHEHYMNAPGQPHWETGHRHSIDPNFEGITWGPTHIPNRGLMSGTSTGLGGPGTPSYTSTPINPSYMTGITDGGDHGHGISTINPNPRGSGTGGRMGGRRRFQTGGHSHDTNVFHHHYTRPNEHRHKNMENLPYTGPGEGTSNMHQVQGSLGWQKSYNYMDQDASVRTQLSSGRHGHTPRPVPSQTIGRGRRSGRGNKMGSVPNPTNGRNSYQVGGAVGAQNNGMCFEGTNHRYSGMSVNAGGVMYSTKGGTMEGNSRKLVPCK